MEDSSDSYTRAYFQENTNIPTNIYELIIGYAFGNEYKDLYVSVMNQFENDNSLSNKFTKKGVRRCLCWRLINIIVLSTLLCFCYYNLHCLIVHGLDTYSNCTWIRYIFTSCPICICI